MGLEEILSKIHEDTDAERAKILAAGRSEADAILKAASERSNSIATQARAQAEKDVQEEKLRVVASARLDVKRQLLQAREEVIQELERGAMGFVDEFVQSKDYAGYLARLIEDGVKKLGGKPTVHVNSRDRNLLKGKQPNYELSDKPIECKGGAVIASSDGKKRVDNTIESLLSERNDELRLRLAEQTFGTKGKRTAVG